MIHGAGLREHGRGAAGGRGDGEPQRPPARGHVARVGGVLVATLLAAGLFTLLVIDFYSASVHGSAISSDNATLILEGQAIAHGNVLLHGWTLPSDSFWTSQDLLAALLVAVDGLRPAFVHLDSALLAALAASIGMIVARAGAATRAAGLAGAAAVALLLALPAPTLQYFLVTGAYHVGTVIWALVAFLALRRARFGWGWIAAVACLAVGTLGDLELVAYGILPVLFAGIVMAARRRDWRGGTPQVAAAVIAGVLAEALHLVAGVFGAFRERQVVGFHGAGEVVGNVKNLPIVFADFLGLDRRYAGYVAPRAFQLLHSALGICVFAGIVTGIAWLVAGAVRGGPARPEGPWILDDMLVLAIACAAASFLFEADQGVLDARYLTACIVVACVWCGRVAARCWPRVRERYGRLLAVAGAAVTLSLAAGFGYQLSRPPRTTTTAQLVAWLESHDLHSGVGDYWTASSSTVQSDGRLTVRPVAASDGRLRDLGILDTSAWYRNQPFQFLVFNLDARTATEVDERTAIATFGVPAHVYAVGQYEVLVWGHPIRVPPGRVTF